MMGRGLKVLLVEHMAQDADAVRDALERSSGAVFELDILRYVSNGENRLSGANYDAVLIDMQLIDPCVEGTHSIRSLKTKYGNAPIIVLAEEHDERSARCALQAGAADYLMKSELGPQLLERSIKLAVENRRHRQTIALHRQRMKRVFQSMPDPLLILDTRFRIRQCNQEALITLGIDRQDMTGRKLETLFADREIFERCTGMLLNGPDGKGLSGEEVFMQRHDGRNFPAILKAAQISSANGICGGYILAIKDSTSERLAVTDHLTSLYNRRFLVEKLNVEFSSARRYGHSLSLSLCDLDHFKQINDSYGHKAGDNVLQSLGRIMTEELRGENIVGRYGGDEFLILFPYTGAEKALVPLERLRKRFEKTVFRPGNGDRFNIAATFGVAELSRNHKNTDQLFEDVDEALYLGKQKGRNVISLKT